MLADAIEASAKSISDYSYDKFEELVNKRIDEKHNQEQQFEECGITLAEINTLKEVFIKTLMSMYHGRVKYPDQIKEEAKEQVKSEIKEQKELVKSEKDRKEIVKEKLNQKFVENIVETAKELRLISLDKDKSDEESSKDVLKENNDENTDKQ